MERRIVRRYASALFRAASAANVVDRVESDLGLLTYTLESSQPLADAIYSPVIAAEKKKAIVRDLFADKVHETTLSYLNLLIDKRREEAIVQTEAEFLELANEARGVVTAEVTTAVKLEEPEEARLKTKLAALTGKNINLVKMIDPAIIGGVTVKIGDKLIDGSVRGRLAEIRERMLGN